MRDQDRPDVETAILDRLVGRQIESRAWPESPDDRHAAAALAGPPADDEAQAETDTDPDDFVAAGGLPPPPDREFARPPEREADFDTGTATTGDVAAVVDPSAAPLPVQDPVTAGDPFPPAAETIVSPVGVTPRVASAPDRDVAAQSVLPVPHAAPVAERADVGDDDLAQLPAEAETLANAESLALRSLLSECATLLQWVCTKAEQGKLSHADVASARAFLAMSGLPPAAGQAQH